MGDNDRIQRAIAAIGEDSEDDWIIAPASHANALSDVTDATELVAILRKSEVVESAREFELADRDANTAQTKFKRVVNQANLAVLATAVSGAAVVVVSSVDLSAFAGKAKFLAELEPWLFAILGLGGIVLGALATMWLSRVRDGQMLQRWTVTRARAENQRLGYFAAIFAASPGNPADPDLTDLLRFEYFRRYLLDSQLRYYTIRSREHDEAADKNLKLGSGWACGATALTGAAGLLAITYPSAASLAGLGMACTAATSNVSTKESIFQERRNAQSYVQVRHSLVEVSKQLDEVRALLARGQSLAMAALYETVRDLLLAEHSQWIEDNKQRGVAIDRLEGELASLREKQELAI